MSAGAAVLLSSPIILSLFLPNDWVTSEWAENLLAPTYPGLLAALETGPFWGMFTGGPHSEDPRGFFVVVFILNIAILWTALFYVFKLIERFTKWRKEQQ